MPRILILTTDLEIGGTPTVVREIAVRLRRGMGESSADDVRVACLAPWGPVARQIQDGGVRVTALGAKTPTDLAVVGRFNALVRESRADTIFSFLIHANAVAAAAAMVFPHLRFIQSIQTTQPRPRWHWRLQRLVHRAAKVVVVPSESAAHAAVEWSAVPREKIAVIPNGVEVGEFAGIRPVHSDVRPFPIGFLGRLDPVKRVPDLVEAAASLNGLVHLHVFGEGPARPEIEARIDRLRAGRHVTLHGTVARPREALERVGLLVLPSEAEGFGLVLIEAMAAGVPVVATDVPGIRDVVRDGETGILAPASKPAALAEAIARAVNDPALRSRLIDRARADVAARFSWDAILPRYRRVLGIQ